MNATKKNPIAERSKAGMTNSLISLMGQKDYRSITIKEICENAGLVRQTFYTNFSSKDDILLYYIDGLMLEIEKQFLRPNSTLRDIIYGTFVCCERHSEEIKLLRDNGFTAMLIERFTRKNRLLSGRFRAGSKNRYYESFYSGAIFSVAADWLRCGMKPSARIMTGIMMEILNSPTRRVF